MLAALKKSKNFKLFYEPLLLTNPVSTAVLGICSALAVTTQVLPSIVMALSMTFVLAFSNVVISLLRNVIPKNIRIIVELTVIATLVTLADQFLSAFLYDIGKQLSVFVGLIITNCIIMGRAEAFALANPPLPSFIDGIGNGFGYGYIIIVVAFFRELLGSGTLLGLQVVPQFLYDIGYTNIGLMVTPAGAFIVIGLLVWGQNVLLKRSGS